MLNPILFATFAFLLLLILLTGLGYRIFYKPGKFLKQLGRPVITELRRVLEESSEPGGSTIVTFLHQLGTKMPSSDEDVATMRATLVRAGFRSENAVPVFFGIRIVTTLGMLVLCVAMEPRLPPNPMLKLMLMISGCAAGWVLPRFFLVTRLRPARNLEEAAALLKSPDFDPKHEAIVEGALRAGCRFFAGLLRHRKRPATRRDRRRAGWHGEGNRTGRNP